MLSKLRLRTRLFAAFGLMAGFCLMAGSLNLWSVRQLDSKLDEVVRNDMPELRASLEADMAHDAARGGIYRAIIGHSRGDSKEVGEGIKEFTKAIEDLRKAFTAMRGKNEVPEILAALKVADGAVADYAKAGEKFGQLLQSSTKPADVATAQVEFEAVFEALAVKMEKLSDAIQADVGTTVKESQQVQSRSFALAIGSTAVALLVAIALALMLDRQISHPLAQAVASLEGASLQVSGASTQITSNGQSLAESTSEQAASLEETSASLEEISAMTKRNAENASNSRTLSQQARDSAASGLERISTMGRTLTSAKTAVGEMESAVSEMQSSSQEIAKIIKTIDEIAFQTNLLALNAAVEAARAGEAGAGFAVVADEVRSLAQRSAQAAKDTSEKIEAAIRRSEFGGVASAKVVQSLGEVETNAASIGQVFQGIVRQITSLDEVINQIASASQEQNSGINEVNMAVTQMDKVTQNNAASAQENAAAAHELNRQTVMLRDLIARLHLMVAGSSDLPAIDSAPAAQPITPSPIARPKAPVLPKSANGRREVSRNGSAGKIPFPDFPMPPEGGTNGNGTNGHGAAGPASNGHSANGAGMHPVSRLPGIPGGFRDF